MIDIIAVIYDSKSDMIPELINVLGIHNITPITRHEFCEFFTNRAKEHQLSKDFVNHFSNKLPYEFYYSDQTTTCNKEFEFCKSDGSCYTQQISIEYSVQPNEAHELDLQEHNNELSGAHTDSFSANESFYG